MAFIGKIGIHQCANFHVPILLQAMPLLVLLTSDLYLAQRGDEPIWETVTPPKTTFQFRTCHSLAMLLFV